MALRHPENLESSGIPPESDEQEGIDSLRHSGKTETVCVF